MIKLKGIITICVSFVVLFGYIGYQSSRITKLQKERNIYVSNTNSLLSQIECYQVDSVTKAGDIKILQLTVDEYKTNRTEDKELIEKLGLKVKQLEGASKTKLEAKIPIHSPVIDSAYVSNDTITHIQKVEMNNEFVHFAGTIKNDSLEATLKLPVTVHQFVYYEYKHKFLWWKWGIGTVRQVITTDNPYVNIKYTEYIKLIKR